MKKRFKPAWRLTVALLMLVALVALMVPAAMTSAAGLPPPNTYIDPVTITGYVAGLDPVTGTSAAQMPLEVEAVKVKLAYTKNTVTYYWHADAGEWQTESQNPDTWDEAQTLTNVWGNQWHWQYDTGLTPGEMPGGDFDKDVVYTITARAWDGYLYDPYPYIYSFQWDGIPPNSSINAIPDEIPFDDITSITGQTSDTAGGEVDRVEVLIQRQSDWKFWNGTAWQGPDVWLDATNTGTNFSTWKIDYNTTPRLAFWTHRDTPGDDAYMVLCRAVDKAGNYETPVDALEHFDVIADLDGVLTGFINPFTLTDYVTDTNLFEITGVVEASPLETITKVEMRVKRDDLKYWNGATPWVETQETWIETDATDGSFNADEEEWEIAKAGTTNALPGTWENARQYTVEIKVWETGPDSTIPVSVTFIIDDALPNNSSITAISDPYDATEGTPLNEVTGTAADSGGGPFPGKLDALRMRIWQDDGSHTYNPGEPCWNGSAWQIDEVWIFTTASDGIFDENTESWKISSTTTPPLAFWQDLNTYGIEIMARDKAGNDEVIDAVPDTWFEYRVNLSLPEPIPPTPIPDTTPPATTTNLAAAAVTATSNINLTWTAPGDDGNTGTASVYDIRYSTATITDANWATATPCTGEPSPSVAGTSQTFTVTGLSPGTTYYFGLKTSDEVPNSSALSNIPHATTLADTTPPATTANLAAAAVTATSNIDLTWTAPGDDGTTGTASVYDIRYSTATITAANWASASLCTGEPSPGVAGTSETFTVTVLSSSTTYYFGLKTADEVPNSSALSNIASATTLGPTPTPSGTDEPVCTIDDIEAEVKTAPNITGGATDDGTIEEVKVTIQRDSDDEYWDGDSWETTEAWLDAEADDGTFNSNDEDWEVASGDKPSTSELGDDKTYNVEITAKSLDDESNWSDEATETFIWDTKDPTTSIDAIDSTIDELDEITGKASDTAPTVETVKLKIRDTDASKYWDGNSWESSTTWVEATNTGTDFSTWKYTSVPDWEDAVEYEIEAKAVDKAGNEDDTPAEESFTFEAAFELEDIDWIDSDNSDTVNEGDKLVFEFSRPVDTDLLDSCTEVNDKLNTSAEGTKDYGTDCTVSWSSDGTKLTVTLGSGETLTGTETVNPKSTVEDEDGNPDATTGTGPEIAPGAEEAEGWEFAGLKWWIWLIIGVAVLILIILLIYLMTRPKGPAAEEEGEFGEFEEGEEEF